MGLAVLVFLALPDIDSARVLMLTARWCFFTDDQDDNDDNEAETTSDPTDSHKTHFNYPKISPPSSS